MLPRSSRLQRTHGGPYLYVATPPHVSGPPELHTSTVYTPASLLQHSIFPPRLHASRVPCTHTSVSPRLQRASRAPYPTSLRTSQGLHKHLSQTCSMQKSPQDIRRASLCLKLRGQWRCHTLLGNSHYSVLTSTLHPTTMSYMPDRNKAGKVTLSLRSPLADYEE